MVNWLMIKTILLRSVIILLVLPAFMLLLLGLLFTPGFFLSALSGSTEHALIFLVVAGGVWGIYALSTLYLQVFYFRSLNFIMPFYGLSAGTLSSLYPLSFTPFVFGVYLIFIGPIIAMAILLAAYHQQNNSF